MNIFDILSFDERVIVLSDPSERVLYTWNKSVTLQMWRRKTHEPWHGNDEWLEVEIQNLSETPSSFEEAKKAAERWYQNLS